MESASLAAMRQVLTWASGQGMSIRGLLSIELESLARVFTSAEPWSFELYEPLRAFSHALPRLNLPDAPAAVHFGDALTALEELLRARGPVWPSHSGIAPGSLAELGYEAMSDGITRLHDQHTAAWQEHATDNKELILRGAERAAGTTALVVGAGKLYDIPLRGLAERFERLLLVDIDEAALRQSVEHSGLSQELRRRLTLAVTDVTGISDTFLHKVRPIFELADERACYEALLGLLHAYCLAQPPELISPELAPEKLAFACSSMVLSQLATPLTQYVERRFSERFPESALVHAHEFRVALAQFTHRIEHAHIAALLCAAPCVALSTDTAEYFTELDAHGNISSSAPLSLIGAPHLEDLVPSQRAHVVTSSEWSWQRVVPTRQAPHGRLLQVVGIVAERTS